VLLGMLDELTADSFAAWHLHGDTTWSHVAVDLEGKPLLDWQETLVRRHQERERA
jgi:polyphosphate kinase